MGTEKPDQISLLDVLEPPTRSTLGSSPYPDDLPGYTDEETGKAAAEIVKKDLGERQMAVLLEIHKAASTADEICDRMNVGHNHVAPRITELRKLRLIQDSGERRKTRSGCTAKVFQLTGTGIREVQKHMKDF